MTILSALAKAKGMGSAKTGTHHWWHQRLTAIANIFLVGWLLWNLTSLIAGGLSWIETRIWLLDPINAIVMIFLLISLGYHIMLGLQVVVEDYVHGKARWFLLIANRFVVIGLTLIGLFSVLKMALGG